MVRLAYVAFVLLASIAHASTDGAVEFLPPGQSAGNTNISGLDWLFLAIGPSGTLDGTASFPSGASEVIETRHAVRWEGPRPLNPIRQSLLTPNDLTPSEVPPHAVTLYEAGPIGGILIAAASLQLGVTNGLLSLDWDGPSGCAAPDFEVEGEIVPWLASPQCWPGTHTIVSAKLGTNLSLNVEARGMARLEMLNLATDCRTGERCIAGGGFSEEDVQMGPGGLAQRREFQYAHIIADDLLLTMNATSAGFIGGARGANMSTQGILRLPVGDSRMCHLGDCVTGEGKTLRLQGNVSLLDLRPVADGSRRLSAQVAGDISGIQLDATPVLFERPASVATALGVAALLAAGAKLILGVLSTRAKADPLSHPNRRLLYGYIQENPGATFRELVRGTGIPAGTARHHIGALLGGRLIQEHAHKSTLRYFENHGRYEETWNTVVLLREPDLKRLHDWVLAHPGSAQGAVVAAGASWGWSRSTTQHRLKRLGEEGLVEFREHGRLKRYWGHEQAPVPVEEGQAGAAAAQVA